MVVRMKKFILFSFLCILGSGLKASDRTVSKVESEAIAQIKDTNQKVNTLIEFCKLIGQYQANLDIRYSQMIEKNDKQFSQLIGQYQANLDTRYSQMIEKNDKQFSQMIEKLEKIDNNLNQSAKKNVYYQIFEKFKPLLQKAEITILPCYWALALTNKYAKQVPFLNLFTLFTNYLENKSTYIIPFLMFIRSMQFIYCCKTKQLSDIKLGEIKEDILRAAIFFITGLKMLNVIKI